jgi:hypothetical protein
MSVNVGLGMLAVGKGSSQVVKVTNGDIFKPQVLTLPEDGIGPFRNVCGGLAT